MKEIQIRRRESKSHLPPPVVANSIKTLASVYDGQGPLKGVNEEVENKLLSKYLGISQDEKGFHEAVRKFWIDIRIKIPSEGTTLNITEVNGEPTNIVEWLYYQFCKRHPDVALNYEEMTKNTHKKFYIYDPDEETKRQNQGNKQKAEAFKELLKLETNYEKMRRVASIMGSVDVKGFSDEVLYNYMHDLINQDPEQFVRLCNDKHLEMKAFVNELISLNILRTIGESVYYIEEKLGDTIEETIIYLNDKKNSDVKMSLKAKEAEAKR